MLVARLRSPLRRHAWAVAVVVVSVVVLSPPVDAGAVLQSAPSLQCVPSPLDLGSVIIGDPPSNGTVTCTNNGRVRATITAVQTTGPNAADFTATATACLRTLSPGDSCQIPVTFAPGDVGPRLAQLQITIAQSPSGPVIVELRGTGVARDTPVEQPDTTLTFEPASLAFAEQLGLTESAAQTVTVTNIGTVPVTVAGATIEGDAASDFTVTTSSCTAATLSPGRSCQIAVTFTPRAPGGRLGSLRIDHNGDGAPHVLPLSGTGTTPALFVSPAVGRAGEVTAAIGFNFPPGQVVTLEWVDPNTGMPGVFPEPAVNATTAGDGAFSLPLLVFPKSLDGPRVLHAAVGFFAADGSLLVVPGSVQGPDFVARA